MTIVVIGHGRSPEGKRWGGLINSCKTVVRMWDWTWQPSSDYGEKYDYGLFVLTPKSFDVFRTHNDRTPARGWLAYFGKPTDCTLPNGVPISVIDPEPLVELGRSFGGRGLSGRLTMTRGTVAAAWALQAASANDSVVLVGFDNVLARTNKPIAESFCPAYWKAYNDRFYVGKPEKYYPTGTPQTETHDMRVELLVLLKLAADRGVELLFAQDIW